MRVGASAGADRHPGFRHRDAEHEWSGTRARAAVAHPPSEGVVHERLHGRRDRATWPRARSDVLPAKAVHADRPGSEDPPGARSTWRRAIKPFGDAFRGGRGKKPRIEE